jgi:hypothetical protein
MKIKNLKNVMKLVFNVIIIIFQMMIMDVLVVTKIVIQFIIMIKYA